MKAKVYFFRLIVGLMAFVLGLGVYWAIKGSQPFEREYPTCLNETKTVTEDLSQKEPIVQFVDSVKEVEEIEKPPGDDFYPDGEYYPYEDLSKEFKDFEWIEVSAYSWENTSEENDYKPEFKTPEGNLHAKKKFKFVKISAVNRQLSFETEKINGISYSFKGSYTTETQFSENKSVDLQGILIKYKNGKKIAQVRVELAAGGC